MYTGAMPEQSPPVESCPIPAGDALFRQYHDAEWGVPQANDQIIFEKICLEGFQSGLSWRTILHKRPAFREAFRQFDVLTVASFNDADVIRLTDNQNIIRNRRKIASAINNANAALELQQRFGSLAAFFWQFEPATDQRPSRVSSQWLKDNTQTAESQQLALSLKKWGFSFVGPTNMYALMQALGIVNDHVHGCHRRKPIERLRSQFVRPVLPD